MDILGFITGSLSATWPALVILLVFIPIGRALYGATARMQNYSFTAHAVDLDNPAVLLRFAGAMVGLVVAFVGSIHATQLGFLEDVKSLVASGLGVIAAMLVSGFVNDKLILPGVNNTNALINDRKVSVGIVEFATFLATGLIYASAVGGPVGTFTENVLWFIGGQVLLISLAYLFGVFVPGARAAVEEGNTSCALALGGFLLSGAYVLREAISHSTADTQWWQIPLVFLVWLAFMLVVELALNYVIIPGARMRKEMQKDNNWGLGLVHGALSVVVTMSFAALVSF